MTLKNYWVAKDTPGHSAADWTYNHSDQNDVANQVNQNTTDIATKGTYSKPGPGIPSSDMTSAVQISLGKADSALQSIASNSITNAMMADDAIGIAELSATGTPSSSTYLRGDNTWNTPASGAALWTSVKDPTYGATGNGSTDDTTAIANAITAAAGSGGSGVVYFPPGIYITSPINVPAGITLRGANAQSFMSWDNTIPDSDAVSQLKLKAGSTAPLISPASTSAVGCVIRDLWLNGNGIHVTSPSTEAGTCINFANNGSSILRSWLIENCVCCNVNSANTASGYAVWVGQNNSGVAMRHCSVFNGQTGYPNLSGYRGIGWYGPDGQINDMWIGGFAESGLAIHGGDTDTTFTWVGGGVFWCNTGILVGGRGPVFMGVSVDHCLNDGIYAAYGFTAVGCDFHTNSIQTNNTWSHIRAAGASHTYNLIGCRTEPLDTGATSNKPAHFLNAEGADVVANMIGCYDGSTGGQLGTGWSNYAGITPKTDSYTLVATDAGKTVEINKATAADLTVPPDSSVPFPLGTEIRVTQLGAGSVTVVQGSGVTVNGVSLSTGAQYAERKIRKRATNTWICT